MFPSLFAREIDFSNKEKAIAALYKDCYPAIRRYILSNKGSVDDAKDIFQEALISFMSKWDQYKASEGNVRAIVITIAKNKWTDMVRKNHRKVPLEDFHVDRLSASEKPDTALLDEEKMEQVGKLLESIGERCKTLITNIVFYGMSMKDIVKTMGFSNENSAKTQHYKCKQKLMEAVAQAGHVKEYFNTTVS